MSTRDSKQVLSELLVYQAQAGDEQAFAELYGLWRSEFLKFARSIARCSTGGEEIAQDAWVGIARGIRKLEDAACFRAWAYRILRCRAVDWVRSRERERQKRELLQDAAELEPPQAAHNTSQELAVLSELIHKLDTDTRMLLHLFYESGLSVSELAEAMGIPAGTVKSRLHSARENLKSKLERKL